MQQVVYPRPATPLLPIRETLQQVVNYSITGRMILCDLQFSPVHRQLGARPPPTPKSSGDYVSASSTSSYAHLLTSSFTLSSGTTDNSSALCRITCRALLIIYSQSQAVAPPLLPII
ncbi:hypothetical protein EV424DRAFT_1540161 [Suillus variegatus]|nr:hypothetical protein EV424DRAFT_1540161 [Suillus variegatus]